jgi:hypothetical protein
VKARLLRRIAAAAVGLAVILPVTTQPARADVNDAYGDIAIDVIVNLFDKLSDGRLSTEEIAQLVLQTINAVNGVKIDVVSRLDAQLVNDLKGEMQFATTSVHYLNTPYAGLYTVRVNGAAHLAKAHVDTVSADRDLDAVGRAMMTLYTLLEIGEAKLGLLQPTRFADYRQGLENLVQKMEPHCSEGALPSVNGYWRTCTFNGTTVRVDQSYGPDGAKISVNGGPWVLGLLDRGVIDEMVMSDTAEKLAKDALEQLRQRGY